MSEWKEKKFKNLVFFQEGPGLTSDLFRERGFPFLNIRCIDLGRIDKAKAQFIDEKVANTIYKHFQLNKGDIVLSTSGSLGKKAIVSENHLPLMLNTSIMRFRSKDLDQLEDEYLFHYLSSPDLLSQITKEAQGSAQVNVGPTHFVKFHFNLPPLPIQRKIARILSTIDGQIEKTEAIIAKYQAVKQGMLQDLFTRGIDVNTGQVRPHPEDAPDLYKPSPLGLISKEWEVVTLKEYMVEARGYIQTGPFGSQLHSHEYAGLSHKTGQVS